MDAANGRPEIEPEGARRAAVSETISFSKKTCPRCQKRVGLGASRCRRCKYPFPEGRGPKPVGLALGAGFPMFLMGSLILFASGISTVLVVGATAMVVVGIALFFDPR